FSLSYSRGPRRRTVAVHGNCLRGPPGLFLALTGGRFSTRLGRRRYLLRQLLLFLGRFPGGAYRDDFVQHVEPEWRAHRDRERGQQPAKSMPADGGPQVGERGNALSLILFVGGVSPSKGNRQTPNALHAPVKLRRGRLILRRFGR